MVLRLFALPFIAIHEGMASHIGHTTDRAHQTNPTAKMPMATRSRVIHHVCSMNW
jgi:hypothetical protein